MRLLSNLEKALDREIEAIENDEYLSDDEKRLEIKELLKEYSEIEREWYGDEKEEY
jgi:hypothetical protein